MTSTPRLQLSPKQLSSDRSPTRLWPLGDVYASTSALDEVLLSSSSWHALTALRQFVEEDRNAQLQAAISVGVASELLLKAAVVRAAPPLLAAGKSWQSTLMTLGHTAATEASAMDFKTIGNDDLFAAYRAIYKGSQLPAHARFKPFVVRNAAAHMAIVETGELREAVRVHCRLSLEVLSCLSVEPSDYWGAASLGDAQSLADEARDQVRALAAVKISQARARIERDLRQFSDGDRRAFLKSLSTEFLTAGGGFAFADLLSTAHEEPFECPACTASGALIYEARRGSLKFDEVEALDAYLEVTGYPVHFQCRACGLQLQDDELDVVPGMADLIFLGRDYEMGQRALEHLDL